MFGSRVHFRFKYRIYLSKMSKYFRILIQLNNLLQIIKYKLRYFYWFFLTKMADELFEKLKIRLLGHIRVKLQFQVLTEEILSIVFNSFVYHNSTVKSELYLSSVYTIFTCMYWTSTVLLRAIKSRCDLRSER